MTKFWNQVDKSGECWLWTGCRDDQGYGRTWADGKSTNTHRLAYRLAHGEIPESAYVLHSCDNPPCVNPAHLRIGTQLDNMRDRSERGRHYNVKKTECIHGHPLDEANTYVTPNGRRNCRTCRAEASRAQRAKRRAA